MAALLFLAIGPESPHQKRSEFGSVPEFAWVFQMHMGGIRGARSCICGAVPGADCTRPFLPRNPYGGRDNAYGWKRALP
jgi:hypothetical protein